MWGELGNSPLDCLSVLSSEVAAPLLRSQIRHGSMPDAAALDLSDSMQEFVSSCERLPSKLIIDHNLPLCISGLGFRIGRC